jgi:hypothetical protein
MYVQACLAAADLHTLLASFYPDNDELASS